MLQFLHVDLLLDFEQIKLYFIFLLLRIRNTIRTESSHKLVIILVMDNKFRLLVLSLIEVSSEPVGDLCVLEPEFDDLVISFVILGGRSSIASKRLVLRVALHQTLIKWLNEVLYV